MVRQITQKSVPVWKSVLAIIVAGGGLLWHLLACTESPMSFSPDGDKLAFVTMEPYDMESFHAGSQIFRLMVLSKDRELRIIEESDKYMLSAPAYSPDGKYMCYLRSPLLTEKNKDLLKKYWEKQREKLDEIESDSGKILFELAAPTDPNLLKKPNIIDQSLPPAKATFDLSKYFITAPLSPAVLVVRDAANYTILQCIEVKIPILPDDNEVFSYLTVKPQYSSDSQWIHLPAGFIVRAINPTTGEMRYLASPITCGDIAATIAALSPDGRTIAALMGGDKEAVLTLLTTDGKRAIYQRLQEAPSLSGIAWMDDNTLVLLYPGSKKCDKPNANTKLDFLRTDGSLVRSLELTLPDRDDDKANAGELALAGDGKHLVLAFGPDVFFLTTDGEILKHYHAKGEGEGEGLAQPIFTPDSKLIAFKRLKEKTEQQYCRVISIDYFTPDGKEVYQVEIPSSGFAPALEKTDDKEKTVKDGQKD